MGAKANGALYYPSAEHLWTRVVPAISDTRVPACNTIIANETRTYTNPYLSFGEQIAAGVLGLYIPFWFLEGDAVLAETMFSQSGRGRLPSFSLPLRTQLTQKGAFSYDKSVLALSEILCRIIMFWDIIW